MGNTQVVTHKAAEIYKENNRNVLEPQLSIRITRRAVIGSSGR